MGVDVAHLILKALCDADDQVVDQGSDCAESSNVLAGAVVKLNIDDILLGLKNCYDWLVPGGKLYVVNITPYLGLFNWQELSKFYLERVKNNEK